MIKLDSVITKIDIEREYQVVKANALIQKTRYNLSTQEQKIILYILTKIKPDDNGDSLYNIQISDFCKVCGIDYKNGKNYADIKAAIKKLSDKSIWIKLDSGEETLLRWIEKPYISKRTGLIKLRLDKDMFPYLLHLSNFFTQYNLYYILAMKSQYSIRLYELLKSYENLRKITFEIPDFKLKMSAEKYVRHADFKRYVLEIAVREINQYGDIVINYVLQKEGRTFKYIKFSITPKSNTDERLKTWVNIEKKLNPKQIDGQLNLYTPREAFETTD